MMIFAFSHSQVMNLIGDVKGKVAVMVDDMIDTAGEFLNFYSMTYRQENI